MQKWQIELYSTPLWLLKTFGGVAAALIIIVLAVGFTRFGRQFRQVLAPCLDRKSSLRIALFISLMVVLLLTEVRLNVLGTFMTNGLYTSMQKADVNALWMFAGLNAAMVLLRAFNGAVNDFFDQALSIKWSERLNKVLVTRWLADKNYYRLQTHRRTISTSVSSRTRRNLSPIPLNLCAACSIPPSHR